MDVKTLAFLFVISSAIVVIADVGESNSFGDVDQVRGGSVMPNGDVDQIVKLRRRRSGNTSGWDPNAPWGMGMDGGEHGHPGGPAGRDRSGPRSSGDVGPGGARVDGRLTPWAAEGGSEGRTGAKGGSRVKGGLPKGSLKDIIFPEEADGIGGGRGRPSNRPKMTPYQRWLQSQLLNQQLRPPPQGPEQGLVPASYPKPPPPPPDYQQLKSRQFRPRLKKLDAYFGRLGVMSEDCRQRLLCEVSREPSRFFPLSNVLEEEAGFTGNYQYLTSQLVNSTEGARLLSYMEANLRGQDRARTCDIFQRRCLSRTEDMINFQSLVVWREMIRWLTIHVLTKVP